MTNKLGFSFGENGNIKRDPRFIKPEKYIESTLVFIVPVSDSVARENYQKTIIEGVELKDIENFIEEKLKEKLKKEYGNNKIKVWGSVSGERNLPTFERMQPGHYLLIYQDGMIKNKCRILTTMRNSELSKFLWGLTEEKTWELVYFLSDMEIIDKDAKEFAKMIGYSEEWIHSVKGFNVINPERIYEKFGSVDKFISALCLSDDSSP